MSAMFDASLFIDLQRLPELYCGFERKANEGPTAYPVACSPQAWSVTVLFMLLQSCLKISINARTKTIIFDKPELPAYLEKIHISKLKVGEHEHLHEVAYMKRARRRVEPDITREWRTAGGQPGRRSPRRAARR